MPEYLSSSPSPEALYIGRETVFLNILHDYRVGKRSFRNILDTYLIIWECDFKFDEIKIAYKNIIDEKINIDDVNFFFEEKKDPTFIIAREKYNRLQMFNPHRQKFVQKI